MNKRKFLDYLIIPLLVIGIVGGVGVSILDTLPDEVEKAAKDKCDETLDSNYTFKYTTGDYKCVTENGSFKPEVKDFKKTSLYGYLSLASLVLAIILIAINPGLPGHAGGRR